MCPIKIRFRLRAALIVTSAILSISLASPDVLAQKSGRKRAAAQKRLPVSAILESEQMLADLGYWTGPIDGKMDEGSRSALIAFQKVEGRKASGRLNEEEMRALGAARRPAAYKTDLAHVEVDLGRQVLFVVGDSGEVLRILPVSTGNGKEFTSEGWTRRAITPRGRFKVHYKIPGWRKSPLGLIYYPVYFLDGIAIHGYSSVPVYPASHGCIRIPMFAAKQFHEMIDVGTQVYIYNSRPAEAEDDLLPQQ